jgi:hypothetical protein
MKDLLFQDYLRKETDQRAYSVTADDTQKKGDVAVTLQTCIQETSCSILVRFSSVSPVESRKNLPLNNPRLPPSKSLPTHHS